VGIVVFFAATGRTVFPDRRYLVEIATCAPIEWAGVPRELIPALKVALRFDPQDRDPAQISRLLPRTNEEPGRQPGQARTLIDCDVLVATRSGTRCRVRIASRGDQPVSELVDRLRVHLPGEETLFVDGRPLPGRGTVADLGLVDGVSISSGAPIEPRRSLPACGLQLRIVGGPDAGRSFPLAVGDNHIGRLAGCQIALPDETVSRRHATVVVGPDDHARLEDHGSTNGTVLEGERIEGSVPLAVGAVFQAGATLLQLATPSDEALQVVAAPGHVEVHRRFRAAVPTWAREVIFPKAAEAGEPPSLNLLWTVAPAAGMAAISLVTGRLELLMFTAVSPVAWIGRSASQRRAWRRRAELESARVRAAQAEATTRLEATLQAERHGRRASAPDLAELADHARRPGRRLWERNPTDLDFLELRLGVATGPSTVKISEGGHGEGPLLMWAAPVSVSLPTVRNLAITGAPEDVAGVAAGLVMQLAVREAPTSVKIVVLSGVAGEASWGWVAWLPHCRWGPDEPFVLVGSDTASTQSRVGELRALIKARAVRRHEHRESTILPAIIVIIEDTSAAIANGFTDVLRDGPDVGVYALCLDRDQVPEQCRAALSIPPGVPDAGRLDRQGEPVVDGLLVDLPDESTLDVVARALAPLRALGQRDGRQEFPVNLRLLDLLDLGGLGPEVLLTRWKEGRGKAAAVVGVTRDGPMELDLRRHGPHALVAGTTRSGKSEFLKTLIASLALSHHPDDLQFLLIDFKDGDDYRLLRALPHTVELATGKDYEGFERTLRMLDAEMGRRQALFAQARATTIEGYLTARRSRPDLPVVGRLLVVADEFGELVTPARDRQLERLVSVARTGAAFGVHLLLVTQKPGGGVTGQIAANVALRICFRVAEASEGIDVIGVSGSAGIADRHRGRGFLQAHNDPPVEFQAARVSGAGPGAAGEHEEPRAWLRPWPELGRVPRAAEEAEAPDSDTDLFDVLKAVQEAATLDGWTVNAVPWPRPLPDAVALDEPSAP
jgi:DNA segregation ATPase FtsK/SpoIIIE, S-DNA-T family